MKRKSGGKDFCGFALPGLFCFAAVVIIPFIYGIYLTLTDWNGVSDTKNFIGGANFLSVLKDSQFWSSLLLTFRHGRPARGTVVHPQPLPLPPGGTPSDKHEFPA